MVITPWRLLLCHEANARQGARQGRRALRNPLFFSRYAFLFRRLQEIMTNRASEGTPWLFTIKSM